MSCHCQLVQKKLLDCWLVPKEHITPVQALLYWLPVSFRIQFKVLFFAFKALNGLAPSYVCKLLHCKPTPRMVRSPHDLLLLASRSHLNVMGIVLLQFMVHNWGIVYHLRLEPLWISLLSNPVLKHLSIPGLFRHFYVLLFISVRSGYSCHWMFHLVYALF